MKIAMSIEQASQATGLGRTKLYEAINSGELMARKYGKRTIILIHDLEQFIQRLEQYGSKRS